MSEIKKRNLWKNSEVIAMLAIIKKNYINSLLDSKFKKKTEVYEDIENKMKRKGFYKKNALQIKNKFKLIRSEYYRAKKSRNQSLSEIERCAYYESLDEILRSRPGAKDEAIDTSSREEFKEFANDTSTDIKDSLLFESSPVVKVESMDTSSCEESNDINNTTTDNEYPLQAILHEEQSVQGQQQPSTSNSGRGKTKLYENAVDAFSKEWKKSQDELIDKLKKQDEEFFKKESELLKQNRRDMEEVLANDRDETRKMMEMFLYSFDEQKKQVSPYPPLYFPGGFLYRSSTTPSFDTTPPQPPLEPVVDNYQTHPKAELNKLEEDTE